MNVHRWFGVLVILAATAGGLRADLGFPPELPGGKKVVTDRSAEFLRPVGKLAEGVSVAKVPPEIDFLYYPGQDYPGKPWSVWGDGLAVGDRYYSSIGDHLAPGGNAFVHEYDSRTRTLRRIVDVRKLIQLPEGHYTPGKIHGRLDMGMDGWLYFSTHRGSTRVTTDRYHYRGDWILRHHPATGKSEIVAHAPLPRQCIPTSVLDPDRLIFYGGTAAGDPQDKSIQFLAYDVKQRRLLHSSPGGPYRYLIFARSTGRVYFTDRDGGTLRRYDPGDAGAVATVPGGIGLRAATQETPDGRVYTVSRDGILWSFNTRDESIERLGAAAVGGETYITTLDADPTGRYLYYVPGAHGGSERDGTAVVQYDVQTRRKKVIAFLHPFYEKTHGYVPLGTYGAAVSPGGETLYITWNGNRGGRDRRGRLPFDTCALTVIHIPAEERTP